jgi:hypothetical protein
MAFRGHPARNMSGVWKHVNCLAIIGHHAVYSIALTTMKKKYIYEYKGHTICIRERSNGSYGWIDGKAFTRGNHKTSKAGDNLFVARRALENAIDIGRY